MSESDVDAIIRNLDIIQKRLEKVEFAVCKVVEWQRARDQLDHDHAVAVAERLKIVRGAIWVGRQGWVRYPAAVATAAAAMKWVS